jgi:outer membrane protein assembly factor BamB
MSTIITKNSANSGSAPSFLVQGELAINVTDGKLFYGSGSGNVVKEFGVTSSYALNALTASYALNQTDPFRILTGSVSATVDVGQNLFLITNNSTPFLAIKQNGVLVLNTQLLELTGSAPNGGIYFTSSSFFIGLD